MFSLCSVPRLRRDDGFGFGFVAIASGSASETEYHLLLAHDLGYLPDEQYQLANERTNEVKKMLRALRERLTALK